MSGERGGRIPDPDDGPLPDGGAPGDGAPDGCAPDGGASDRSPSDQPSIAAPSPAAVPDVDVLVVDNYDSFAYNLVQYVGELAGDVTVRRNDAIDVADVRSLDPDAVVVSPGPGHPEDAGVSTALFGEPDLPILGVCLGHQALCAACGASVERAPAVVHGKPSVVEHDGAGIYRGLPERLRVGRYHSLAVPREELPDELAETAWTVGGTAASSSGAATDATTADGRSVLMGVRHRQRPHYGVQFHPESILTGAAGSRDAASLALGEQLVARFCELAAAHRGAENVEERGAVNDAGDGVEYDAEDRAGDGEERDGGDRS